MKLSALARLIPGCEVSGQGNPEITRVDYDSRKVAPGSLFVAIEGARADGHDFVTQAFERGAVAAAVQRVPPGAADKPLLIVPDARLALALFAAELADYPDRQMELVAVTGTNGKTTTVCLLADTFSQAWGISGLIGTLGNRIGDRWQVQERTTPEAPDIYLLLNRMRQEGCRAAAVEVSSHALALQRVYGIKFTVAVFTNLTQDHLDFHGDIESYFEAKAALFRDYSIGTAVINADDQYGRRLLSMVSSPALTYSLELKAEVRVVSLDLDIKGIHMVAETPRGKVEFSSPLVGRFNAYNLLCALTVVEALDLSHADFVAAAAAFEGVPGRLESFDLNGRWAYVDYAHTPEALKLTLRELKKLVRGPVHVLFGCGGNRDRAKRPLMGRAAEKYADKVYVSTDNPRDEDPEVIAADILAGMDHPHRAVTILDRRQAIVAALHELPQSGVLLIAGKGHETYQEIGGAKRPFDDREEVRRFIAEQAQ